MVDKLIPALNLHLTKQCNMKCAYCFAGFKQTKKCYSPQDTLKLILELKKLGFEKINFVGGEPLLFPDLSKLLKHTKNLGFYTSIVTNGSLLNKAFLMENRNNIDNIGLSIDSLDAQNNLLIGRVRAKNPCNKDFYMHLVDMINELGIALKINTVVSKINMEEDLTGFINYANPIRWKLFQVLKVDNENDTNFTNFEVSAEEFNHFVNTQKKGLIDNDILVVEKNEIIRGSYLMINPDGKFFDNTNGGYTVSGEIIKIGIEKALTQIKFNYEKFNLRNGHFYKQLKLKEAC